MINYDDQIKLENKIIDLIRITYPDLSIYWTIKLIEHLHLRLENLFESQKEIAIQKTQDTELGSFINER